MKKVSSLATIAFALFALGNGAAFAQNGTAAPATPATGSNTVDNTRTRTVKEILRRIEDGAGTGVRIVADSSVIDERAPLPTEATTPENFEAQLDALVKKLPQGTTWAKLYLPAGETTRAYKGDDLAEFALAETKLFGKVGAAPAGSVEVMGKIMPVEKAQPVIEALNLKPIYLLANPLAKAANSGDINAWNSMSDEQKKEFAKSEAQRRLSQGPDAFAQTFGNYMGQQMSIMGQMFGMMNPEQRQQYTQALSQAMMSQMQSGGAMNMMMMQRGGPGANGAPKQ